MDKYKQVIADYAKNRISLSNNKNQIDKLFTDESGEYVAIDLNEYRKEFLDEHSNYGQYPKWEGWVECLLATDEYTELEMNLAILLDKKKEILREAGQIKRNICSIGRALLTNQGE